MRIRVSSFVVTALLAATAHPAAAQDWALGRGSIAVGGSASFTSTGGEVNGNESDDRLTTIALAPSLQFFLTERFSFGGSLSFAYASEGDDSITTWGIGPAATYYFGEHGRSTHPYLGAGVDFSRQSDDSSEDRDRTGFRGAAGLLFLLSEAIGIHAELFYRSTSSEAGNVDIDTNTVGLAVGFSAFLF